MHQTYRAIIKGDRIFWVDKHPNLKEETEVCITLLDNAAESQTFERGQKMASLLTQLAQSNPFRAMQDPVSWQQEQRQDRTLPFREV